VVTTATLDRLLHHSHIINIQGNLYRLKEKKEAGLFYKPIVYKNFKVKNVKIDHQFIKKGFSCQ